MTHSGNTSEAQESLCFLVKTRNNYKLQIISDPEENCIGVALAVFAGQGRIQFMTYSLSKAPIKNEDNLIGKFQHLPHPF